MPNSVTKEPPGSRGEKKNVLLSVLFFLWSGIRYPDNTSCQSDFRKSPICGGLPIVFNKRGWNIIG